MEIKYSYPIELKATLNSKFSLKSSQRISVIPQ